MDSENTNCKFGLTNKNEGRKERKREREGGRKKERNERRNSFRGEASGGVEKCQQFPKLLKTFSYFKPGRLNSILNIVRLEGLLRWTYLGGLHNGLLFQEPSRWLKF